MTVVTAPTCGNARLAFGRIHTRHLQRCGWRTCNAGPGLLTQAAQTLDALPAAIDDSERRIVAFERARIAARDTGRHLVGSALRPPARMPHVAHGRRVPGGFWSRLLGGKG